MSFVVKDFSAGYGDTRVLWDVSLEVGDGEIVALIGSNGAGKSTLLGAISGLVDVWSGSVRYRERELARLPPDQIVRAGVVQVPQARRLFGGLTVRENLLMGAYLRMDSEVEADLEHVLGLLPRLRERYGYLAGRLSGGEQQRLAFARVLLARPQTIFLDEATSALDEEGEAELYRLLRAAPWQPTVISVGHRSTLRAFHERQLSLEGASAG